LIEHLNKPRGRERRGRADGGRSGDEEGIEGAVIARVQDGDCASGIDELDADEIEGLVEGVDARKGRIDAEDEIDVAVDVSEERGIVKERGATGALPDGVESGFDGASGGKICGGGAEGDGFTEEKIDHGVNAPADVIFDDGFAVRGVGGVDAGREGALLRQGVPAMLRGGIGREGIAVVGVEFAEEWEALGVVSGECRGEAEAEWFVRGHGKLQRWDTSASLPMELSDAFARANVSHGVCEK